MPKFFDDYSNTYLTHDSAAGRKQQRRGWKFRENFKLHYEKQLSDWRASEMGIAVQQQAYIRGNTNNPHAVPPLPDGWEEEEDGATRAKYYINTKTQERTWMRPGFYLGNGPPPPPRNLPPPSHFSGSMPPSGPPGSFPPPGLPPPGHHGLPPPPGSFPPPGLPPPGHHGLPPPPGLPPPHGLPPPGHHGLPPPPGGAQQ